MKTKKQLAAAAAAAAAAADKKAAPAGSSPTATAPIAIKKPVKRLQSKAKESPPKSIESKATTSASEPLQATSPKPKPSGNPKSPIPAKQESAPSPVGKNVKAVPLVSATGPSGAGGARKSDAPKVKKSAPAAGGKKSGGGGSSAGDKKKIQKELKNLGITDKAINQIDTATVECNPSISEMVKTKSRATVIQQKCADFGALGGPLAIQKTVAFAVHSSKQEGPAENLKSLELVVTTPTKKKPVSKTKDTKQDPATAREEGAKNKTPVTAQLPTPSAPPSSLSQSNTAAKEDVKVPTGAKNPDSKTKAKKPESKDDNDATAVAVTGEQQQSQQQQQQQQQKAGKKSSTTVPKPKPKSKKAILEEKRAAEVKAAAEAAAVAAAAAIAKQEAEDKQRMEEHRTCSLELVESDDKNDEEEVQSRIEDIVKSLEDDDDDEEMGMGLRLEEFKIEPKVDKEDSDAKKKQPPKVVKIKSETDKKAKKPIVRKPDEVDNKNQSANASVEHDESANNSNNQDNLKGTAKRKYTKPKNPTDKPKKSPVKKKKPESKGETGSPTSNQESPNTISKPSTPASNPVAVPIQSSYSATDETVQRTSDPNASDHTESSEPPKSIRSSTENDDDLPLNRLKDQSKTQTEKPETFAEPQLPLSSAKAGPSAPAATPFSTKPSTTKRKYVRKIPSSSGSKKKPTKVTAVTTLLKDSKEKKPMEKKDVYDFDESESETDSPVKPPGKPIFKRKQLETSTSKEEEDLEDEPAKVHLEEVESMQGEVESRKQNESESDKDEEAKKVAKKTPVKSLTKTIAAQKKEGESDSGEISAKKPIKSASRNKVVKETSTDSEGEDSDDDMERDPDHRQATDNKIKQEAQDSSDDDSDGYTSEESVRTRIVKKQLTAKTRHLKLYGFWSGPKRHRVASLNAIAKVHCLYENETRAALEASLMKQASAKPPRAREVKKEKAEEEAKKGDLAKEEEKKKVSEELKKVEEEKIKEQEEKKLKEEEKKQKDEEKKQKEEEKKQKDEEKKKAQKTAAVKEEKKKVGKKSEGKEDKKKESKKVEVKEEKKDDKKKEKEKKKEETESDTESDESEEEVVTRTLRCVPGLRGVGKHWDPDASSMESGADDIADSDETYTQGKDTDPVKKRKVKRKVIKKPKPKPKADKSDKPKPPAKKIKKEVKALLSDAEKQQLQQQQDDESSSSSAGSEKAPAKSKSEEAKKRKREPKEKKEVVEVLGKKRMASLNATAMLAATYEVQRILYRNTDSDSDSPAEKPKAKKAKEQKEAKEKADEKKAAAKAATKDAKNEEDAGSSTKAAEKEKSKEKEKDKDKGKEKEKEKEVGQLVTVKTEPMRDRTGEPAEVKRELEEPRPVSNNVVIAQDTEVTITGVYVNSGLGASQEAYCKMQYRVQQSVTEERLVRPGEAPPKSYTPLTALSSMRPPNDQAAQLSTPPLFGQPAQCDSPLGMVGPPRGFYPPPTSSSGSSSAFCAPIPHDSPGYYQPAGPLISPHLLSQAPPSSSSQQSASSSTITKQPPESDSPVQSLTQPPSSSTADSTDSDVLLTGGDLSSRSQSYSRYGPSGPPNLYPRPVQMHCPPPHLAPNYYAAPPYSQYPPEMYYAHAYPPAHFYPKFAQYYPTSRRYYPGHPGPGEHMYEQPPPPTSGPLPPPSGAQLVPAGPQGPQHLEHYPGPPPYPYPGYGSPGPGPGGQCYSRNLQPPPYMDAHYTTNCPCQMQSCPKNVNAGSLIGIKASKGPVASTTTQNSHHIASTAGLYPAVSQTTANNNHHEPILISSGSSTSSSPAPLDLHSPPIMHPVEVAPPSSYSSSMITTATTTNTTMASNTSTTSPAMTTNTTFTTTAPPPEPTIAHQVKPESDLHPYSYHHYHHPHRPSAPPPTHPLHHFNASTGPLLTDVKEEPSTPTLESESKSINNIPKLLPLTTATAMIKQELTEVKLEPPATVTCKKEDFEENGPAMTPDLLLDEALIKKEGLVSELCFKETQKLDDKSILSNILTAEANLKTSKTTGSDSCSINNNSNNNSVSNNNSSISNEKVQLVDSVLPEIPASTVKRRPLLVACKKSTPKKSPPNSYKNLIKRTNVDDESTITVLSDDEEEEEDEDDEERAAKKKPKPRKLLLAKPRKVLKRTRRVFGAEQLHHLKKINKTLFKTNRIRSVAPRPSCIPRDPKISEPMETITIPEDPVVETKAVATDSKPFVENPHEEQPRPMSNVDLTIDLVAKGYFSEPEILSIEAKANSRLLKKLKQQEGRSQSEQNRGKQDRSSEGSKHSTSKKPKKLNPLDVDFDKRKNKSKSKKMEATANPSESNEQKKSSKTKQQSFSEPKEKKQKKEAKQCSKKKSNAKAPKVSGKKRATSSPLTPSMAVEASPEMEESKQPEEEIQPNPLEMNATGAESTVDDRETDFDDATTMLVDDDMMSVDTNTMIHRLNNNNNSVIENKNAMGMTVEEDDPLATSATSVADLSMGIPAPEENKLLDLRDDPMEDEDDDDDDDDEEEIMLARRFAKKGCGSLKQRASRSRSKSKSRKFSIKKRHRIRMAAEVEEVIVPRKSTSAPRWSNGWTWEGQPFQGKVFLNSDDPPVLRTCYPAMRHSEGDAIRPRDCVLLRAGSKRAELPYVAKVAHLWENPEDGEMMMSLLWYYRPEHTEQGRQAVDGPDEVFASRHKDHNSVACIEDKCYVLTFSEYCRFRRLLKGFEEGIEEHPSIVPPLRRESTRLPPPVVAPDLVMYCQRVYEFRLKRLLKTPS